MRVSDSFNTHHQTELGLAARLYGLVYWGDVRPGQRMIIEEKVQSLFSQGEGHRILRAFANAGPLVQGGVDTLEVLKGAIKKVGIENDDFLREIDRIYKLKVAVNQYELPDIQRVFAPFDTKDEVQLKKPMALPKGVEPQHGYWGHEAMKSARGYQNGNNTNEIGAPNLQN